MKGMIRNQIIDILSDLGNHSLLSLQSVLCSVIHGIVFRANSREIVGVTFVLFQSFVLCLLHGIGPIILPFPIRLLASEPDFARVT